MHFLDHDFTTPKCILTMWKYSVIIWMSTEWNVLNIFMQCTELPPYRIRKTFEFYIFNHNYYQKIVQVISKTVMRKWSLRVFSSFGGMIYYESKSMFIIYSTRSLQNYYIYFLWKFYRTVFYMKLKFTSTFSVQKLWQKHIAWYFFPLVSKKVQRFVVHFYQEKMWYRSFSLSLWLRVITVFKISYTE